MTDKIKLKKAYLTLSQSKFSEFYGKMITGSPITNKSKKLIVKERLTDRVICVLPPVSEHKAVNYLKINYSSYPVSKLELHYV